MGKRKSDKVDKSDKVEHEVKDSRKENRLTRMDSEDDGEASSDLNESGKENVIDLVQSDGKLLVREEDDDPVCQEDEEGSEPDAQGPNPFSRAFGKIMKKSVPQSTLADISGPILAERKQLLFKKFEEAETDAKAKTSGAEEKREVREKGHVLPLTYTDAKEKAFMKLATKGVVRLFNAVSKAQTVQADADTSNTQATKATLKQSKAVFMTELRAGSKAEVKGSQADEMLEQDGKDVEPGWAALRTDFMLGTSKKLVDWDKGDFGR